MSSRSVFHRSLVCAFVVVACLDRVAVHGAEPKPDAPVLVTEIDRTEVRAGAVLTIKNTSRAGADLDARGELLVVFRVAEFDGLGRVVHYRPVGIVSLWNDVSRDFPGLPDGWLSGSGRLEFDPAREVWQGFTLKFEAKRPGIYLLRADWLVGDGGILSSRPVVLTVRPSLVGRP